MKELGEYLKREREMRQISLGKIAEETKIPLRYLEAIERGDVDKLPGEVYVKGFLRSYAVELGLNELEVLERYRQLKDKEAESIEEKAVRARRTPPKKKKVSWRLRYERAFVTLLLLVLLVAALYAAFRPKNQSSPPAQPQSGRQEVPEEVPEPEPLPELEEKPQVVKNLEIFARDNCWVEAYSQGERLFAIMFNPGERRQVPVRENLTLLLGKPAAVSLKYGEKPVEGLGKETVTVVFDEKGEYQIHRGRKEEFFR